MVNKKKETFVFFTPLYQKNSMPTDAELRVLDAECRLDDFLNYDYTEGLQPLCWVEGWLKRKYN